MRTVTIEKILGPVADAVGDLVVLFETSEAEKRQLPDLVNIAESVSKSVQSLLKVGGNVSVTTTDAQMKQELQQGCQNLQSASDNLVQCAYQLRKEPNNVTLKRNLILAANGILNGTRQVLESFDDGEVRRVIAACRQAATQVQTLKFSLSIEVLAQNILSICESIVQAANLAAARVDELLGANLKERLRDASDSLKRYSAMLVSSAKMVALEPKNMDASVTRDRCVKIVEEALQEIEVVVQLHAADVRERRATEFGTARNVVATHLLDVKRAVESSNSAEVAASLEAYLASVNQITKNAQAFVQDLSPNDLRREAILAAVNYINAGRLLQVAKEAASKPNVPSIQKLFYDELVATNEACDQINRLTNAVVLDNFMLAHGMVRDHQATGTALAEFYDAARGGNLGLLETRTAAFERSARRMFHEANRTAEHCADTRKAQQISDRVLKLERLLPIVLESGKILGRNPRNQFAAEHFTNVVREWDTQVGPLADAVLAAYPSQDLFPNVRQNLKRVLADISDSLKSHNIERTNQLMAELSLQLLQASESIQREIDNTDDKTLKTGLANELASFKQGMVHRICIVSRLIRSILVESDRLTKEIKRLEGLPWSNDTQRQLQSQSDRLLENVDRLEALIQHSQPSKANLLSMEVNLRGIEIASSQPGIEEPMVVYEPAPQPLPADEARANPLKAAAQELRVEASNYDARDNSIVQLVEQMTEDFLLL